jgi:hypothetical protein
MLLMQGRSDKTTQIGPLRLLIAPLDPSSRSQHDFYGCPHMDLSSAFDTNVGLHSFERKMTSVSSLTRSVNFSFLNVGAGFMLSKVKLFPTEAARGAAQMVLVRKLLLCIIRVANVLTRAFLFDRISLYRACCSLVSFLRLLRRTSARWVH